jgi:hypothetical protein
MPRSGAERAVADAAPPERTSAFGSTFSEVTNAWVMSPMGALRAWAKALYTTSTERAL